MLKLDIFPHIFPQAFFERMKTIAEKNPALGSQLKRWLHSRETQQIIDKIVEKSTSPSPPRAPTE